MRSKRWMLGALLAPALAVGLAAAHGQQTPLKYSVGDQFAYQSLPAPDGGEVDLADYKGKAIFLNFFASW